MQSENDHIHMIVNYKPHISIKLKSISTVAIWKSFQSLLGNHFWSDGYFVASIRNASAEIVQKYIE